MKLSNSNKQNSFSCIELLKGIYNAAKQNKQEFEMFEIDEINEVNKENVCKDKFSKIHIRLITEKTDYECGILD